MTFDAVMLITYMAIMMFALAGAWALMSLILWARDALSDRDAGSS